MEKHLQMNGSSRKIAVVGGGYWGKNLIRNYHDIGALRLVCDKNKAILENIHKKYPDVDVCFALSDVLGRNDIDGVVLATPAEAHFSMAREVLLSGKHVYVEKPLVLEEKEAKLLISLAGERSKVLMVGHLLQYHPAFVHLKKLVYQGELGRINYIYSHRLNLGKIRREENILWSFAPHDISMILSLAEEDPEVVFAVGGNYLHQKIADVTTTHLKFSSGLQAHIFVSWLHPFKEQKLVVVGDRKMAVFDDSQPWEEKLLLYPHEIKWKKNIPIPAKAKPERIDIFRDEPLRLECQHFLECINKGKTPITDGNEGLRVLKILKACQESLDHNSKSVLLRETGDSHFEKTIAAISETKRNLDNQTIAEEVGKVSDVFVHETAVADSGSKIGSGTKIWHFSHILSGTILGERCNIGQNVVIGPDVVVGDGCKIQNNVSIYKGVTLEDEVFCGPSMVFTNVYNPRAHIRRMGEVRKTLVKKGATLGANATIICGVTLGRYSFIGAGAVVTRNVPDHALVLGNPARQVGWICECGEKLGDTFICPACAKKFLKGTDGLAAERN